MKRIVKIVGFVMTVAAIILVTVKVYNYNVNFSLMFTSRTLLPSLIYLLLQTALIMLSALPWKTFLSFLADKQIPLKNAIRVFGESSIYKYIPGNVFQYVARNKLAFDLDISHLDVAVATFLDILSNLFCASVISLLLLNKDILYLLSLINVEKIFIAAIILVVSFAVLLLLSKKFIGYIKTVKSKINKGNIKQFLKHLFFYVGYCFLNHVALLASYYFLIIRLTPETLSVNAIIRILGAYILAWLIGFITPGSPGGIGVREAAMMIVCPKSIDSDILILFVLILRVLSVFSDVLALIFSKLIKTESSIIRKV